MTRTVLNDFPDYSINEKGIILNDNTGRIMRTTRNQRGHVQAHLRRDGLAFTRAVGFLVGSTFLANEYDPGIFDTICYLDGDKTHVDLKNLAWRPRWWVWKYNEQFDFLKLHGKMSEHTIFDEICATDTGLRYNGSEHAAVELCLLNMDVVKSVWSDGRYLVRPTQQRFVRL